MHKIYLPKCLHVLFLLSEISRSRISIVFFSFNIDVLLLLSYVYNFLNYLTFYISLNKQETNGLSETTRAIKRAKWIFKVP